MCLTIYILSIITGESVWWTNWVISIQTHVSRETSQWKRSRLLLFLLPHFGLAKYTYTSSVCIQVMTLSIFFFFIYLSMTTQSIPYILRTPLFQYKYFYNSCLFSVRIIYGTSSEGVKLWCRRSVDGWKIWFDSFY